MTIKIWRDRELNPYAVIAHGRLFKIGKPAQRDTVRQVMRRLDFSTAGVGTVRTGEAAQPASDDPGSTCQAPKAVPARSLHWGGLAA